MVELTMAEIRPGMVTAQKICIPGSESVLVKEGVALSAAVIKRLKEAKLEVIQIADRNTLFVSPMDSMEITLETALREKLAKIAPNSIEANKSDRMYDIAKKVSRLITKIVKAESVLNFCVELKIVENNRLFIPALYTSIYSMLVAGAMECSDSEIFEAGVGGLLHDVGTIEMPFLIGNNKKKPQEELLWKEHTTYGYYFSIQANVPRNIADIILKHHEKCDGSGYPKGLTKEEIPLLSRIVNLCTSYVDKVYVEKIKPHEVMDELYALSGTIYDEKVIEAFINNIAIYPLGALVRLTTGDIGIVSNVRLNKGDRPVVRLYYNRVNKPLSEPKVLDLGRERTIFITEVYD